MSVGVGNIRIEPADVVHEIEEQWLLTMVADQSDSFDGVHFQLATAGNTTPTHYVWFDNGASADPAPGGLTGIAVSYTTDDNAATMATNVFNDMDADGTFNVAIPTVGGSDILITNQATGACADTANVDTPINSFTQCQEGGTFDLGLLDGDISISFEETLFDVTAHQTGTTLRAKLRQGISAEISMVLKETDLDKLYRVFALNAGGAASETEFGWGDSRQGTNVIVQARRLHLHPVALDAADLSRDLVFWKTYMQPTSLTYSGENPNMIEVTFAAFLDENKNSEYNLFKFGDYTADIP